MRWRIGLAVAVATLLLAACSSGGGTITIGGRRANDHGSSDVGDDPSVEVEADNDGSDFYFGPTVIEATGGRTITIELNNEGDAEHNFSVESLGIDQDIEPGDSAEVEVELPASGTLTFFCEYHEESGMLGEFRIS